MSDYNFFGATSDQVAACYPGTTESEMGGQSAIEAVMGRAARAVAMALPQAAHDAVTDVVRYEILADGSVTGNSVTLGLAPVADTVYLWKYSGGLPSFHPRPGVHATEGHSRSGTAVTLDSALSLDQWLIAQYRVDQSSLDMPQLADIVVYLAAAEIGSALYDAGPTGGRWQLVDDYQARADRLLDDLKAGKGLPDSLRRLRLWGPDLSAGGPFALRRSRA